MKVSLRMKTFIEHALPNAPFWDICCDHGHIGLEASLRGTFSEVHFVDQVPHIMKKLEELIASKPKGQTPLFIHCLAAEKLDLKIEGTFLVAGVGGLTISTIIKPLLENNRLACERLLLSPQTDEKTLLLFIDSDIMKLSYSLTAKILIPEGKRVRSLYVFDQIRPR